MDREMCSYLEWLLHVEAPELEAFAQRVKKEYGANSIRVLPQWASTPAAIAPWHQSLPPTRCTHRISFRSPSSRHPFLKA